MKISRSDSFILSSWVKLLVILGLMFIMSAVVPLTATFPGLGFPCYFNTLVNYSALNLTVRSSAKHLTPTLFLEAPEMFVYISWAFLVDGYLLCYYAWAILAIFKAKRVHATTMTSLQTWIVLIGSHSVVFMSILRLWTIQLFIHVLSYKHILLASFVYCIHFCLSFTHVQAMISCNSATWSLRVLEQQIPENSLLDTLLRYGKPIGANLYLSLIAMEMLVFSLGTMMAIGNSFYMLVSDIVFGSINLFFVLTIAWYINTELFLVKYLKHQIGFYVGVFVSYLILLLPVVRYDKVFISASLHKVIAVNISMIPITCILAIILRIIRNDWKWCAKSPEYAPLPQGPKEKTTKVKYSPELNALYETEEDVSDYEDAYPKYI
ncbi:glycoprotein M [Macaca mulatta rhadinovirus 17577]|uniref:Glycoprotein M n=3 Tax=Macacine gammaherpesvirus 5 TaxID=154334 RepID=Q77NJ4_9GAMA|nr:glycoprotein M [Macacine gammaherpesvirus 5]AAD21366.1 glycoprotein M [Macaca mulatta rhadinovirus 17577]AAF60018.1 glycoprotein M [Rhesus monkey rhadinovirus H26-95]ADB08293.1 glycoprotein gM [Macaca mulatta rhadinovirus]WUF06333.1 glycoprotein M [synthetic construct]ADB08295.1 glycoprotein gM [Macaca mulatta rhadinovirus]